MPDRRFRIARPILSIPLLVAALEAQQPASTGTAAHHRMLVELSDALSRSSEEALTVGARLLRALSKQPHYGTESKIRQLIARAYSNLEKFGEARNQLVQARELAREAKDQMALVKCLANLAIAGFRLGEFELATSSNREALRIAESLQRTDLVWRIANTAGAVALRQGDYRDAIEFYRKALKIHQDGGDPSHLATVLNNISVAHMYVGNYAESLACLERVLRLVGTDDPAKLAAVKANMGDVHHLKGDNRRALELHREALELRRRQDSEAEISGSHHSLGNIYLALKEGQSALDHLKLAFEIRQRLGLRSEVAATLSTMAEVYAFLDQQAAALDAAAQSVDLAQALDMKGRRIDALDALAKAQESSGDNEAALRTHEQARELERELGALAVRQEYARFQAELEDWEKRQQIQLLEKEKQLQAVSLEKQIVMRNSLIAGSALLLGLCLLGWNRLIVRRRAHRELSKAHRELQAASEAARRDHEQRRALEQELAVSQKRESLGILAGGVAHDFNNLLTGVLGNASMALQDLPAESPVRRRIADIECAAERASELTEQMLTYSGRPGLAHSALDLNAIVTEMVGLLRAGIAKKISIALDLADELPAIRGNPTQVRQVVMNLVTNSAESIGADSGVVTISTRIPDGVPTNGSTALDAADMVCLEVADTGCGMDPEAAEQARDPFFTTKFTGRGLGLATVSGIVRGHGGSLHIESEPDKGTVVRVLWPASQEAPTAPAEPDSGEAQRGSGTILLVDDEEVVRRMASTALQKAGYDVVTATNGREAVRLFEERGDAFDCVVLDLTMPEMDGAESLSRIRELRPEVPAILSSGFSNETTPGAGLKQVEFLPKPYRPRVLLEKIHAARAAAGRRARKTGA